MESYFKISFDLWTIHGSAWGNHMQSQSVLGLPQAWPQP